MTSKYRTEYLQTDAPVDSGNSGGPLISLTSGKIVGINTAAMKEPKSKNTNFAVSMKYACRVLELLQAGRDPSPPQLPLVFFRNLDGDQRVALGLESLGGFVALGTQVTPSHAPVLSHARDVNLRVGRGRRLATHDDLVGPTGIRNAEHSADVIGVIPILKQEGELHGPVVAGVLLIELAQLRLLAYRLHERHYGNP